MRAVASLSLLTLSASITGVASQYSATYLPSTAPKTSEEGQTGTNQCGTESSPTSSCQNAYINSLDDWCIWAPPNGGSGSVIGNTERIEVAYCLKSGYGTRLIPDGTIKGAHWVQTPDFVQVTGYGDFTKTNVPSGDAGGELDPHGADGNGNPIGGLVFSSAFGPLQQIHEWTNFMSATQFCFRACKPGPKAAQYCQHIYDVLGCDWNMPANYSVGVFESCKGDSGEPMGVYGKSTFHQGEPVTPPPHPRPSSSECSFVTSIGNAGGTTTTAVPISTSGDFSSPVSSRTTQTNSAPIGSSNSAPLSTGATSSPSPSNAASTFAHAPINLEKLVELITPCLFAALAGGMIIF